MNCADYAEPLFGSFQRVEDSQSRQFQEIPVVSPNFVRAVFQGNHPNLQIEHARTNHRPIGGRLQKPLRKSFAGNPDVNQGLFD